MKRTKKQIETSAKKPTPRKVQREHIPQEMRANKQWVLWSYQWVKGKWAKVPYSPGGTEASSTDPSTWSTFDDVLRSGTQCRGQYSGIGFVFAEDDPYTGIDLDDCIDAETGELKPWAQAIIAELNSYTETSPSGTGVKIWARGHKPSNERCKTKYEDGEVEMYDRGRYFAMTGEHWPGTPATVEDRQAQVDALYHKVFAGKTKKGNKPETGAPRPETRLLSDNDLIEKAGLSKNGDKFARLMAGDTSDYHGDDSSADQALCNRLAFWTDKDHQQMDRIFRSSGLMRDKWDEQRGEKTYGQRTIEEACAFVTETYQGSRCRPRGGTPSANGNGHASNNGNDQAHRPEIILGSDEYRVNDEAIAALSDHTAAPEVFQRGNSLVTVLRARKTLKKSTFDRPDGSPRIAVMPGPRVCEILTRVADFIALKKKKNGDTVGVPAHPPDRCIAAVLARADWPSIRPLEAVIEAPTLRPDGTVLDVAGWDPDSGLLYEPNAVYPPILQTPSKTDAIDAANVLLDLVAKFPFAPSDYGEIHKAAWLAGLLTALVRFAIHGPCPLFLFDANCPATGKSKLADVIALAATGREMSRTAYPDNDEELRKRITSVALAGDLLMLLDNIEQGRPLGGSSLDAVLTATTWRDRILGRSEMTAELPMQTVWFGTGNNVTLKGDMQRRVIPCRLETAEENPEQRTGFKYPDLLEHVRTNRPRLVCAALTVLRAHAVAGRPQPSLPTFGSYEGWSTVVRSAVAWVTGCDPCATRRGLRAADPALTNLAALLEGWSELPGGKTGLTVAEMLGILNNPDRQDSFVLLRGALMEWSRNDKLPGPGPIGYKLRSFRGRVVNGLALHSETGHGGAQRWRIIGEGLQGPFGDDG